MKNLFILVTCILFLITAHYAHSLNLPSASKGFEPNQGQIASFEGERVNSILFSTKENGYSLYFKTEGVSYVMYQHESKGLSSAMNRMMPEAERPVDTRVHYARIDLDLVNSRIERSNIIYEEELPGYTNYYLAHCPEGILNVRSYNKVRIKCVYPGIDWVFRYDKRGELHHEFEVIPGADVNQIKFNVKWADVKISPDGKQMVLSTPMGEIKDGKIISHESIREVDVRYRIGGDGKIGYQVTNWSGRDKLIIDPPLALLWATYYGGSNLDYGNFLTTDGAGNVFVTGETRTFNFPLQNPGGGAYYQGIIGGGINDAFILKFTNTGARQWASYYGGTSFDEGFSLVTDGTGNVFMTGQTSSTDFPLQNPGGGAFYQETYVGGGSDAFILKFTDTGVRQWGTYYGGSSYESCNSLATDGSGNVFVSGTTGSTDFPLLNPGGGAYYQGTYGGAGSDAFILKFTNTGTRQWATYYGGSDSDWGSSLDTDSSGNVTVTGATRSFNFPLLNPGGGAYYQGTSGGDYDGFILKFTNTGTRLWTTFYGGSSTDIGRSLAIDSSGNVLMVGYTVSTNFPLHNPGGGAYYQGTYGGGNLDAFILKFSNTGVRQWSTYYGGLGNDWPSSIASDGSGNVFVTGQTHSDNFPLQNPGGGAYFQEINGGGGYDAFILKFTNTGTRRWATYYGGNDGGSGNEDIGTSLATDGSGNVFMTGWAESTNLPLQNPGGGAYYQGTHGGVYDAFILKFESSLTEIQPIGNFVPSEFVLKQNYPNPFNPATKIDFDIPSHTRVKLTVYDITGREVSRIVDGELSAGSYSVGFDAGALSSGLYLYRLEAGDYVKTDRMMLVK